MNESNINYRSGTHRSTLDTWAQRLLGGSPGNPQLWLSSLTALTLMGLCLAFGVLVWTNLDNVPQTQWIISAGVWAVVALVVSLTLGLGWALAVHLSNRLQQAHFDLEVVSVQDSATQTYKKQHFLNLADAEWTRCRRYGVDAAILLLESDELDNVLSEHGQMCRDALMRDMSLIARGSLRKADVLGRFGDKQLIIFVPHTDHLGALDVAERIREQAEQLVLPWDGYKLRSTLSIGIASLGPNHSNLDAMVTDAVRALAQAQSDGRNCVRAAALQPRKVSAKTKPPVDSARFTTPPRRSS